MVNAKENSDSSERSSQTDVDKKSNLVLPQLQRKCKRRTRNVQNPSNEQRKGLIIQKIKGFNKFFKVVGR